MSLYRNQTRLTISLDCGVDVTAATTKQIFYKKPNRTTGVWPASSVGSILSYQVQDGDIDVAGQWQFQAYVVLSGKKAYGEITYQHFNEPLN